MDSTIVIINPETDGAIPVKAKLKNVGDKIEIEYGGLKGIIIQLKIKDLQTLLADELHG